MTKLPRLDPNEWGNAHLHELIGQLHPDDAGPFIRQLTTLPLRSKFHVYRELLFGAHLRRNGADWRYERSINGKTPDWSLYDENSRLMEIVDVLTLHQRKEKESKISTSLRSSGIYSGWIGIPADHIHRKFSDKAGQYSELVEQTGIPYVLGVFGEFAASLSPDEIQRVLYLQHDGWFKTFPKVSGVIYFMEKNFCYEFSYFPNPEALYPSSLFSSPTECDIR